MNDNPSIALSHAERRMQNPLSTAIHSSEMHMVYLINTMGFDTAVSAMISIVLTFCNQHISPERHVKFLDEMKRTVLEAVSQIGTNEPDAVGPTVGRA